MGNGGRFKSKVDNCDTKSYRKLHNKKGRKIQVGDPHC